MVGRSVVALADDDTKRQSLQLSALVAEVLQNVERFQEYGFTSVPLPGAEAVFVCAQGNRDHPIVIACDDKNFRKSGLSPGEVAIHGILPDGRFIYLMNDGTIQVQTENKFEVITPQVLLGPGIAQEPVIKGTTFQGIYNAHTHLSNLPGFVSTPPVVPLTGLELSLVTQTD